jgi:hypothetical protein
MVSWNVPYATSGPVDHIPFYAGLHEHEYMHFCVSRCPVPPKHCNTLFFHLVLETGECLRKFYVLQISNLCNYLSCQNVQLAVQSSELLTGNK